MTAATSHRRRGGRGLTAAGSSGAGRQCDSVFCGAWMGSCVGARRAWLQFLALRLREAAAAGFGRWLTEGSEQFAMSDSHMACGGVLGLQRLGEQYAAEAFN